jgi:high-affinity nickel permease
MRHALYVDHISTIDNLTRLYNAVKKFCCISIGFSTDHMTSVLVEMIFTIYAIGSVTNTDNLHFGGRVIDSIALGIVGTIGAINIYSMVNQGKRFQIHAICHSGNALIITSVVSYEIITGS